MVGSENSPVFREPSEGLKKRKHGEADETVEPPRTRKKAKATEGGGNEMLPKRTRQKAAAAADASGRQTR